MEICLNNTWGFLCGEGWKNSEASVVCQQLGFSQYGKLHLATLCSIGVNCKIFFWYATIKGGMCYVAALFTVM